MNETVLRLCLAFVVLVAGLALGAPAWGHDWYTKTGCCGGYDCRVLEPGEIEFTTTDDGADAWLVVETGEVIPAAEVRASPDGQNHRCEYLMGKRKGKTRMMGAMGAAPPQYCLWIAEGSF